MRSWTRVSLLLLVSGCGLSFPNEYLIEDLRPLEIRIDPPEIPLFRLRPGENLELDLARPPAFDLRPVRVTAQVAHPDSSATFRYDWTRCGITFEGLPCEESPRERLTSQSGPSFEFSPVELLVADAADKGLSLTQLAAGLVQDPRDLLGGFYLNVDLQVTVVEAGEEVDTLSIEATKRVVLFDPRIVALTITETAKLDPNELPGIPGLELPRLCSGANTEEVASLLEYLRQRAPNHAPVLGGVVVGVRGRPDTSTRTVGLGQVVALEAGETLVMRAVLEAGVEESYQVIDGNCELRDFEERVATSWFTNGGVLSRQVSTLESPIVSWQPPEEPEKQRSSYRIYAVVRDGRGGSDGAWFDVLYR